MSRNALDQDRKHDLFWVITAFLRTSNKYQALFLNYMKTEIKKNNNNNQTNKNGRW